MKSFPFDLSDWSAFKKIPPRSRLQKRKVLSHNLDVYVEWVMALLKKSQTRELKKNERYTILGIHMHPKNVDYLNDYIDPWNFLAYAPVYDDTVPIDQVNVHFFCENKLPFQE